MIQLFHICLYNIIKHIFEKLYFNFRFLIKLQNIHKLLSVILIYALIKLYNSIKLYLSHKKDIYIKLIKIFDNIKENNKKKTQ